MIVLNELAFAEKMNKFGFVEKYSIYELSIYAKWLKSKGDDNEAISIKLIEFCEKWQPNFTYDVDYYKIDAAVSSTDKYKLREPIPTEVTENEWDIIFTVDNEQYRKSLFIMLVISKYFKHNNTKIIDDKDIRQKESKERNKNVYFCNLSDVDIVKLAGFRFKEVRQRNKMFHYFQNKKLLDITKGKRSTRIVKFVDNESKSKISITDYDNIILYYERETCGNIGTCLECGGLFRQNKQSNREYCRAHRGYSRRGTKNINCIDCDTEVNVDAKDNETIRCNECRMIHKRELKRLEMQRYRQRKKNV